MSDVEAALRLLGAMAVIAAVILVAYIRDKEN